MESWFKCPSRL